MVIETYMYTFYTSSQSAIRFLTAFLRCQYVCK